MMRIFKTSFFLLLSSLFALLSLHVSQVQAQAFEANILGLAPVPQPKLGQSAPATTPVSAKLSGQAGKAGASSAPAPVPAQVQQKQVAFGEMTVEHGIRNGVGNVVFTSKTTYSTSGQKSDQLEAAKAIQQRVVLSCGKQCKPAPMSPPQITPAGQLRFGVSFQPLHKHLNGTQFSAILQGQALNLTPDQLTAPKVDLSNAVIAVPQGSAAPAK